MNDAFSRYRELEEQLVRIRWMYQGMESDEEDAILEEMDEVWWRLTEEERQRLNEQKPESLILSKAPISRHRQFNDVDIWSSPGVPVRILREVA